jgi:DNA-binding NtrC family response regulator
MVELLRLLDIVVDTDYPVLITGESGTGKELVARCVHRYGARRDGPFVAENCAAIAENLLEAELFGYVKGAFTGADRDRKGLFEEAHRGTLFLDEIGDMDLSMQRKLLRVLQDGEFRKVGGREPIKVDVRILSATNADLSQALEDGRFREDLYYRLKVMSVRMPPLRERRADIPALVAHFAAAHAAETGRPVPEFADAAMAILMNHSWPGNVRELRNEVLRLAATAERRVGPELLRGLGEGVRPPHLPLAGRTLAELEKEAIQQALEAARGKRVEAARLLGLPRRTFYNRLKRYGLS